MMRISWNFCVLNSKTIRGCMADTTTSVADALAMDGNTRTMLSSQTGACLMNGTMFVGALRRQGCTSHIIIYSGKELDREMQKVFDAGANEYVGRRGNPEREFDELKDHIRKLPVPAQNPAE